MPVINNATFLYTKIQSPVLAYNKEDTEFSCDVVLSKTDAKAISKEFPKQRAKEYDNDEFESKFKIPLPFPKQDEQYVLKLKKAHTKGGKTTPEQYFPRVFMVTEEGNVDKTYDLLVGNGSFGKASYRVKETDSYGNFIELQSILIETLVPYESKGGSIGAEFGVTKLADVPQNQRVVQKQGDTEDAPKAIVKPIKKATVDVDSFDSDQSPF